MKYRIKVSVVVLAIGIAAAIFSDRQSAQVTTEKAGEKFKSIQVLNEMPADQMGKVMNMISAGLGVNCGFCHASNDGDYEKEGFEKKEVARRMMRMVFELNDSYFKGKPRVSCNTCHNGQPRPRADFPLGFSAPAVRVSAVPVKTVSADAIIANYEKSLGGRDRLLAVTSRQIKSMRLEPDGKTTEPETIYLKGNKYAADLLYGDYLVREVFDGTTSRKFGMSSPIALKTDEMEQIKRDAEMFSPATLKLTYPALAFLGVEKIDGREAYEVIGITGSGVRESIYFDLRTGFLVRRSASTPTVLGDFVYQVDYSDYKDFGGVKMPTSIRYAVPHISWTRKIVEVRTNVAIDDSVFGVPSIKK